MAAIGRRNLASIVLLPLVQELIARIALKAEQPSRTLSFGTGDLYGKTASRQSRSGGGGWSAQLASCRGERRGGPLGCSSASSCGCSWRTLHPSACAGSSPDRNPAESIGSAPSFRPLSKVRKHAEKAKENLESESGCRNGLLLKPASSLSLRQTDASESVCKAASGPEGASEAMARAACRASPSD